MSDRFALDANAAIDYLRPDRDPPPQLAHARELFMPLPVAGELFAGAYSARRRAENLAEVEQLIGRSTLVTPDLQTARVYGTLRGEVRFRIAISRMNDLWIAALCLQHDLPLLTNDRGFASVPGLTVITW